MIAYRSRVGACGWTWVYPHTPTRSLGGLTTRRAVPTRSTTVSSAPNQPENPPQPVSRDSGREGLHITIDGYQREYLEDGAGGQVNVSELVRATLDDVIPPSEQPDDPPDRRFEVDVDLDGALSHLAQTNGSDPATNDE